VKSFQNIDFKFFQIRITVFTRLTKDMVMEDMVMDMVFTAHLVFYMAMDYIEDKLFY
jgi:hypothetical protein